MKNISVEKIHSFREHTNATSLVCAKVLGWPVVVRKGEFNEGDLVVFVYPDVVCDANNPYFSFMENRKYIVWLAKFRGEPSAGLVCPLSLLAFYGLDTSIVYEGMNLSEALPAFKKYERVVETKDADAKGNFPTSLISMTDEDNLLSNPRVFDELRAAGKVYITLKIDGQSYTYVNYKGEIEVCSRKLSKRDGDNKWWNIARKYNLIESLKGVNIALQAELAGPAIQKNHCGLTELGLFVFNVKDLDSGEYFGFYRLSSLCANLKIPMVPLVGIYDVCPEINELQQIANAARYSNGLLAEGIVIRPVEPQKSYELSRNLSVKVLNQDYDSKELI